MKDKKSSKELSHEEVGKIQLRVENALSALEETLDSIDQENKFFPKLTEPIIVFRFTGDSI